jgi:hypothetical protein
MQGPSSGQTLFIQLAKSFVVGSLGICSLSPAAARVCPPRRLNAVACRGGWAFLKQSGVFLSFSKPLTGVRLTHPSPPALKQRTRWWEGFKCCNETGPGQPGWNKCSCQGAIGAAEGGSHLLMGRFNGSQRTGMESRASRRGPKWRPASTGQRQGLRSPMDVVWELSPHRPSLPCCARCRPKRDGASTITETTDLDNGPLWFLCGCAAVSQGDLPCRAPGAAAGRLDIDRAISYTVVVSNIAWQTHTNSCSCSQATCLLHVHAGDAHTHELAYTHNKAIDDGLHGIYSV